ncbi:serine/threonine-protein kinase Nek4-like isoform X2 [Mercenaria mercenaria]|uniref:serine/threonine-protein kinase Nek4-like isoform X2 n=1 Tax=Mercenaria mercenaria TaxID=6596 RepID=UPI00234F18A6|nr:serine/threonine-protein kinase Nek4-like isoform X2 [Mercenaria mercenaria]
MSLVKIFKSCYRINAQGLFALKTIELDEHKKTRTKEAVQKEAKILSQLKHPHIVLYHESFFDSDFEYLHIIQDYCDGGNLDDKIKTAAVKTRHFDETQIMEWFIQIIMAVQYIHSKKVLHRDLKAENVFLTKKNVVKIGDFGISKVLENTIDVAQTIVGTPSYLSPELCQDIPYSSKSDVWAVGCLLYELCALKSPFDAQNLISLFFKIIKCEFEPIPSIYSRELLELVNMILVKSPDDRPSASALLNTALVKKHLAMFIQQKENLLQQKSSKDDSTSSTSTPQHTPSGGLKQKVPKSNIDKPSPVLKRNKLKISTPMLQKTDLLADNTELTSRERLPHGQDSGLGVSAETDILKENRLDVSRLDAEALSDYSDDFDEADSDTEEDIKEEIECADSGGSEDEIEDITENTDEVEYADDFEEYDSSEDLDAMVHLAREAQDIAAVDDWFSDSISDLQRQQTAMLRQQCKEALGGRGLKEVERLVSDGTLTEEDLSPRFALKRSLGEDSAEICHLNIDELELG